MNKKVILMILDCGAGKPQTQISAIEIAQHPFYKDSHLYQIRQIPIFWQMNECEPYRKDKWAEISEVRSHWKPRGVVSFTKDFWPKLTWPFDQDTFKKYEQVFERLRFLFAKTNDKPVHFRIACDGGVLAIHSA